jgi:hypothetical protein
MEAEDVKKDPAADWITEKPCHAANDTFLAVIDAAATTVPGLVAKATYLQDLAR